LISEEDKPKAVSLIQELRDIVCNVVTYEKPQVERNRIADRMRAIKKELEDISKRSKDV
jgi:hypothetical protein